MSSRTATCSDALLPARARAARCTARTSPGAPGRTRPPAAIVSGWLASPGHRANLLRPGLNRIGLGALEGNFLGYAGATVVTADFAGSA